MCVCNDNGREPARWRWTAGRASVDDLKLTFGSCCLCEMTIATWLENNICDQREQSKATLGFEKRQIHFLFHMVQEITAEKRCNFRNLYLKVHCVRFRGIY